MPPKIISKLNKLPAEPGVYVFKDKDDNVLYVAKTSNIRETVLEYFTESESRKRNYIKKTAFDIEYHLIEDEYEAASKELDLIKNHHPPLNRRREDEKQYRFIRLSTTEKFPRARVIKTNDPQGNKMLGPFPKSRHIKHALRLAVNHFEIADCSLPIKLGAKTKVVKTCLRRKTKQCLRPCEVEIDIDYYNNRVTRFIQFFEGENDEVVRDLKQKMDQAVEEKKFELAAKLRDDLATLDKVFNY